MTLVVSGMGKVKAAGATASALAALPRNSVCINVGIAGSDLPIGQLVRAHSVTDAATGQHWYPQLTVASDIPTTSVRTVDQPATGYEKDTSFDMEAAAFIQTAQMYGTSELIQSVKVISDNPAEPLPSESSPFSTTFVSSLIESQLEPLTRFIDQLQRLAAILPAEANLESLLQEWCGLYRFTVTEQRQLRRQLQRYNAIFKQLPEPSLPATLDKPATTIGLLDQQISQKSIRY